MNEDIILNTALATQNTLCMESLHAIRKSLNSLPKKLTINDLSLICAEINKIAAITGMGMSDASGIKSTKTRSRIMACTIPATGLLPPFLIFADVRAMAPVAGMPPNSAEQMLPAP